MKPIDQQSWDQFSTAWNTDVKAGLIGIQAALNTPMKPGGRVLVMSSAASMVLAGPFIAPESLRLSGGYIGAKRMLWFMAHSANAVSRERGLGLQFQVLVPCQLIPSTTLGHQVAAAYAEIEGVSIESMSCNVMARSCARWRLENGSRATRRPTLYTRRRLRLSQRYGHPAARRMIHRSLPS
jgi:hypothetical protein